MYTCVCTYIYIYVYIYIYMYIHTYIHTYIGAVDSAMAWSDEEDETFTLEVFQDYPEEVNKAHYNK